MITRALDYLIHGADAGQFVNLGNPHTQAKIAIAQARMNADLWSCVWPRYSRDPVVERRERKIAAQTRRPARVITWQRKMGE